MRLISIRALGLLAAVPVAMTVAGCGGGSSNGVGSNGATLGGALTGSAATSVYVVQNPGQILEFAAGANGSAMPIATLTTGMAGITALATDSSGRIYVAGIFTSAPALIEIFAAGASGTATPTRTITVTDPYAPTAMTVDSSGSLYTVAQSDGVVNVYSSTASGAATPTRILSGTLTQLGFLNGPTGIVVDSSGNLYVASSPYLAGTAVEVFSPTATGNVAPIRVITNPNGFPSGEAIDANGDIYLGLQVATQPYVTSIVEYAPGAYGAATPLRTIAGTATGLINAGGLSVDGAGSIFTNAQPSIASGYVGYVPTLERFGASATGNVAPASSFTSSSWTYGGFVNALR